MTNSYILAIDQGTSSTKTLLFDQNGQVAARASEPLITSYFGDGFVEQDPEELVRNVLISVGKCIGSFAAEGGDLKAIGACGISNQRETFVVWDETGVPFHNAIVWQCKRSIQICERLKAEGLEQRIQEKTGLFIDPYFSGTKLIWLYENDEKVRQAVDAGKAYFGTVDTWLLYKLTNGQHYLTDYTNASRTLFFNLKTLSWDQELLAAFGLSTLNLPEPKPSSTFFGESNFNGLFDQTLPITSLIGDSHAAAFGEGCFAPGTAKATLGTGCSIMMNIGEEPITSQQGMVTTICWSTEERPGRRSVDYALEGVIVTCGATIEWLKNSLGLFAESRETEEMATAVPDNGGVYIVPAFSGLGAPHWQMTRKASISGLTFGSTKNHVVRAALESIPYQIKDVLVAMEQDTGIPLDELMVHGGISANQFVVQFLADLLGKPVVNRDMPDVSALGAAYLAGLKTGLFKSLDHLQTLNAGKVSITPNVERSAVEKAYAGWQAALKA
ncbi:MULTISPECIES: glycerol kinase GlpK [unclassified Spirosoma]|uniref:FGGY family carbohydrate kinase n=1 Tax=unclassified Spirosoma TaxID=2621999 RepID=UPI000969E1AC|nr:MULTISPECIES: glycerol kinase GlpK [unclassified Spirosoma]MBN8822630.1 glycerol kinase GlpK [Spirosoma sp.]OJW74119.1 MAG: carbohydrate kinase [Spirosoma sp. 48-14]